MKLIIKDLSKKYLDFQVLEKINITFEKGKIYGLIGRNGSGKTTLFNCINDLIEYEEGEVLLEKDGVIRKIKHQEVGLIFTQPHLPQFLTGYEFVKFYMKLNTDSDLAILDSYFDDFGLSFNDRHKLIKDYSHGMKNKIQMMLSFIKRPPVILLDEPLTSLDLIIAQEIKKQIRAIKDDHIIIFSTHILELAKDLCDEIVILNKRKLEKLDNLAMERSDFENEIITILKGEENE